jgi:integral membrane protein
MTSLRTFRIAAFTEGVSLLILVLIAMPLGHLAGARVAIRIAGSVHGLCFLWYLGALAAVASEHDWPRHRWLTALGAAVIPGGTFALRGSVGLTDRPH